ncbi:hypothetical protein OHB00_01810 [Streptomyces sp. NBC_00631]|uniref:hypothetical protein n=1 Tax=Streptomyces sp. NBC_00631 TaxID=2975793 RepID=UPI0030E54283
MPVDRVHALRTELEVAGLTSMAPTLELAAAFHRAVLDDHDALTVALSRLGDLTQDGGYAYYLDLVHFMAGLPLAHTSSARWLDGEPATRRLWRALVTDRHRLLGGTQ